MTFAVVQRNLAGGEIAPSVSYRTDLTRGVTGGRTFRNLYPNKTGAGVGRAGLVMGWETKDSTKHSRLMPFVFNSSDAYMLEFGDLYMRLGVTGGQIIVPSALPWDTLRAYFPGDIVSILGIAYVCIQIADDTIAAPAGTPTYWSVTTNVALPWDTLATYSVGDVVYFTGFNYYCTAPADATIADPATATGYWYKQSNVPIAPPAIAWSNATTYQAFDRASAGGLNWRANSINTNVDPTGASTMTWTPYNASIFEMPTPYTAEEVYGLTGKRIYKWQSNDVVYITQPAHPPYILARTGLVSWTLKVAVWGPNIAPPTTLAAVDGGSAGAGFDIRYRATAIDKNSDEESLPGNATPLTGTIDFSTAPVSIIIAADPYATGDEIVVLLVTSGVDPLSASASAVLNKTFTLTRTSANHYQLNGATISVVDAFFHNAVTVASTYAKVAATGGGTAANPNVVTIAAVANAKEYWVYADVTVAGGTSASLYGFLGRTTTTTFNDTLTAASAPNLQLTPPTYFNPAPAAGDYPAVVGNVQQRLVFAASNNAPAKVQMSQPGNWRNFTSHSPKNDSDVVIFTPATEQANATQHVAPLDEMALLTSGETFLALTNSDGKITQDFPDLHSQDSFGASDVIPVRVNGGLLYIDHTGQVLREMAFDLAGRAPSRDLTSFAPHLFLGRSVKEMAFARAPDPLFWCVMSDGGLLSFTFLKEQQIEGWARHDSHNGADFESVAVIPEGNRHVPYFIVKRTINGTTKRYVEWLADRKAGDPAYAVAADSRHFDAMRTWDGRNTTSTTMTIGGGGPWTNGSTLTLTAVVTPNTKVFLAGETGNRYLLTAATGETALVQVVSLVTGLQVVVTAVGDVPTQLQSVATATWTKQITALRMDHLPGETVGALADGEVVTQQTVTAGIITFSTPAGLIHAGLPFVTDFESLDVDWQGGTGNQSAMPVADIIVEASRFFSVGPDFANLKDWQDRGYADPNKASTPLFTGKANIHKITTWTNANRVCVRQSHGLPLTILGLVARVAAGGHG